MTDAMRIYVGDLAAYNSGILHGRWIDLDEHSFDADSVHDVITAMLRDSPTPNVLVTCPECEDEEAYRCESCKGAGEVPSAEEFAIHDHEGLGDTVGEYSPISEVCELAALIDEHGDVARAALELGEGMETAKRRVEAGCVVVEDYADFALDYCEDLGCEIPSFLCIDWERTGRELAMDMTPVRYDGLLYLFHE